MTTASESIPLDSKITIEETSEPPVTIAPSKSSVILIPESEIDDSHVESTSSDEPPPSELHAFVSRQFNLLHGCCYTLGSWVAWFIGADQPKFQYVIDGLESEAEYQREQQEAEREMLGLGPDEPLPNQIQDVEAESVPSTETKTHTVSDNTSESIA